MIFLKICNYFIVIIALYGAYLNSKKKISGFYLWTLSNAYLCFYNSMIKEFAISFLFFIYLIITLNGIRVWRKK